MALALMLIGWIGVRSWAAWDGQALRIPATLTAVAPHPLLSPRRLAVQGPADQAPAGSPPHQAPSARRAAFGTGAQGPRSPPRPPPVHPPFLLFEAGPSGGPPGSARPFSPDLARNGPSHAKARSPEPQEFYEPLVEKDDPRWSGENWLLMRAGSGSAAQAPGAASYGASQAGAIVRYRFGKGEAPDSYAYLRTSLAINAPGKDKEVALGLGLRPIRRLPVRALVEARLQDTSRSSMQVRPVATLVTELPWQRLPRGFRLEAYGQAGYAGGRGATPFFDAQALIDHPVRGIVSRNGDLRAGIGMWSGGQKGAVRLDLGPRVSFRLEGGKLIGPTRIALDWRFRVTGNARPGSGPAMTVSSAF